MIQVSAITNNTTAKPVTFFGISEFCTFLTTCVAWSPGLYNDEYRLKTNFLVQPSTFVLDIDDGLNLKDARARLTKLGYQFILGTSRNHQKLKNGVVTDRYRIILFLERPIISEDEYNGTWDTIFTLFPEMDKTCREVGRQYFPCKEIAATEDGSLVSIVTAIEKPYAAKTVTTTAKDLSKGSMRYLLQGIPAGSRDSIVFRIASDAKKNGYSETEITDMLLKAPIEYTHDFTENTVIAKVRDVYKRESTDFHEQQNVEHKLFLSNCFLAIDPTGEHKDVVINRDTMVMKVYSQNVIKMLIGKDAYYNLERKVVDYKYKPDKKTMFVNDAEGPILNTYVPASWIRNKFYYGTELGKNELIPKVISEFLQHLVAGDTASYEYVLDWMAQMVQGRNLTILTLVGNEGIGKGTLSDLLRDLVGQQNWVKVRADAFKGRFNSQMENKLLVHIDEAHLRTTDEYNRLKDVVNPWIEVEQKGKDARMSENFASYILASNDNTAINPSADDRRFSIINLTNKKIIDTPVRDIINQLYLPETIDALGLYLMGHTPKHDMMKPFKSARKAAEITHANMPDWEKFLLLDYLEDHVGEKMSLTAVKGDIAQECGMRNPPGRGKLEKFCMKYPKFAKLVQVGRARYIKVIGCPEKSEVVHYEQLGDK